MVLGNKGLKGYERFPAKFIGVHWLLAAIIGVSAIVLIIGFVVMQSEKQSEIRKGFMGYCVEQKLLGSDMRMRGALVAECEKDWERIRNEKGQRGKGN